MQITNFARQQHPSLSVTAVGGRRASGEPSPLRGASSAGARISPDRSGRSRRLHAILVAVSLIAVHASVAGAQQICGDWVEVDPPMGATLAVTEVKAVSELDAWAFAIPLGLVRWDGTSWNQFPVDDPNGSYPVVYFRQFGVVGTSHLFLAGQGSNSPFSTDQVLKIWDGVEWSGWHALTLQPNVQGAPRNGAATAVVGAAVDDVWLLGNVDPFGSGGGGTVLTVHWDGFQLTELITPGIGNRQNNLNDAVAIATDDVWAVGNYENIVVPPLGFHGATYHWDGSSWSAIPNPTDALTTATLHAVSAVSSDDVWAAGVQGNEPLFVHWNGTEWTIVQAPPTTGVIHGLAAISSSDVWAVDFAAQVPAIGKYYHWDGVAWSIVTPPTIPSAVTVNRHGGLAAVGECDVWAVGSIDVGSGIGPFIERLQGDGALPIFADSFETGDTSAWSTTND